MMIKQGQLVILSFGIITTLAQNSTIIFNVAPTLVNNSLTVNQGGSVILTNSMLSATDLDSSVDLIFSINAIQYEHFESLKNKGVIIASFTQSEIQKGQIQFISDGSSNVPSYGVTVSNGKISSSIEFSTISFHVLPLLVNNVLTLEQG